MSPTSHSTQYHSDTANLLDGQTVSRDAPDLVSAPDPIRDFVNALLSNTDDGHCVLHGDVVVTAPNLQYLKDHAADLRLVPLTENGSVAFLHRVVECDDPSATAVLAKDDRYIACYALTTPVSVEEAQPVADAFGMMNIAEPIPFPGEWQLIRCDMNVSSTLDELKADYCGNASDAPKMHDAVVHNSYNPADHSKVVTITGGANKESKKWVPKKMTTSLVLDLFCKHPVGDKDGPGIVPGEIVGKQRRAPSVKYIDFLILDNDSGTPFEDNVSAILDAGLLGVCVTTHSNGDTETSIVKDLLTKLGDGTDVTQELVKRYLREEKHWVPAVVESISEFREEFTDKGRTIIVRHQPISKTRIVMPLAEPFEFAKEGKTHKEAMAKWAKVYEAAANKIGIPFDKTCTDPSRLYFTPRHDEGKPFQAAICGGEYLNWRDLVLDDPITDFVKQTNKSKSKSVTEEGRALGKWSMKRAHGFQIADVVNDLCPEKIRGKATNGFDIECPFDSEHSNSGDADDRACFVVNAGDGSSEFFTISCRHESCRKFTMLDMLGKMLADAWFDESVLTDENYNAILEDDEPSNGADVKEPYEIALEELKEGASDEEVERVYKLIHEAKLSTNKAMQAKELFKSKLNLPAADFNKIMKSLAEKMREIGTHPKLERAIENLPKKGTPDDVQNILEMMSKLDLNSTAYDHFLGMIREKRPKLRLKSLRMDYSNLCKEQNGGNKDKDAKGKVIVRYDGAYNFDEIVDEARDVLLRNNDREGKPIFSHIDGRVVRMHENTTTGRVIFQEMTSTSLWSEINELMCLVKRGEKGDGAREKVPEDVARLVFETGYKILPPTPEVVYTPIFIQGGVVLTEPGFYGPPSGMDDQNLYMANTGFKIEPINPDPSFKEMQEALNWIKTEILHDFPFLDNTDDGNERREPSETNAMSMLLTPFMRRMISGNTPVFFVTKPQPGTGGTLLGKIPLILFDGIESPPMRYSQNEEEMSKGLVASIMETRSHLFFDDVKEFNNRELLRAITSAHVGGRILGKSKNVSAKNNFGWIGTGNNPNIGSEMERRIVWIRLNAKSADIQKRTFRHDSFEKFLLDNRATAVHNLLTLIMYWISTGSVPFTERKRASFEDWSAKVGGVLQACGMQGFLDNRRDPGQDIDEGAIKYMIRAMLTKYGTNHFLEPSDIFKWATDDEMDILDGSNDDQKKARFFRKLPTLDGRTFDIGGQNYMMRSGVNKYDNTAYYLMKLPDDEGPDNA